ncbi:hypothetical protein [Microbacterium elymi]|uniref:Uncharacterized protein n=1 Tax=Microbacterium elymi TaxID=2909587 RepID=A0ABY5NKD7_9MICO|nr:hypothetical protein [Microbacterium elymi]UUT35596.1 hypothetical protein L2X98_20045 [Microbacterium elymi]
MSTVAKPMTRIRRRNSVGADALPSITTANTPIAGSRVSSGRASTSSGVPSQIVSRWMPMPARIATIPRPKKPRTARVVPITRST